MDNFTKVDDGHVCCYTCDNRGWKFDGVRAEDNVQGCSGTGDHSELQFSLYCISSVIGQGFLLPKQSQKSRSIFKDGSRFFRVVLERKIPWEGKTFPKICIHLF